MKKEQDFDHIAKRIEEMIQSIDYGSVTVVIQDGKVVQLEKQEKERLR